MENRRNTSAVWAFFEMLPAKDDNDRPYCKCKKCGAEYLSSSSYGIRNLKRHIKSCYKLFGEYEYLKVRDKLFALFGEYTINI
jgi:ArsR family metal-binding transcriptional regulator